MTLGPHANFIVTAYGFGVLVIAALIGWVIADHARQRRALAELEASGVNRRADRS